MTPEALNNRTVEPIVQSDSTVISPPLIGIVLLEGGALKFRDTVGNEVTKTFPLLEDGGAYPFFLGIRMDMVFATGTDISDDDMIGVR